MLEVQEKVQMENNQDFYRFTFDKAVVGKLSIDSIAGTKVRENKTIVNIQDFSATGASFESQLNFPVREDVEFTLKTKLLDKEVELRGVLSQKSNNDEKFKYDLKFAFDKSKDYLQKELVKIVNSLQIASRHGRKKGYRFLESISNL